MTVSLPFCEGHSIVIQGGRKRPGELSWTIQHGELLTFELRRDEGHQAATPSSSEDEDDDPMSPPSPDLGQNAEPGCMSGPAEDAESRGSRSRSPRRDSAQEDLGQQGHAISLDEALPPPHFDLTVQHLGLPHTHVAPGRYYDETLAPCLAATIKAQPP